jgi:hypothetical protein
VVQTDVTVLVPRVRRAVEGVGAPAVLSDDALKDLVADAIAEVILYTGSVFGKQLVVTHVDGTTGAPDQYATSDALTLEEAAVIAAQAALDYFFHQFANLKISETISDESTSWDYQLSATLLRDQLQLLISQRDKALEAIEAAGFAFDKYESFLAVRDRHTAQLVEPWVDGVLDAGAGAPMVLYPDYRFGGY